MIIFLTLKLDNKCEKKPFFRIMETWDRQFRSFTCFQCTSMLHVLSSGCSCFKNIVRHHDLMSQTCLTNLML